MTINMNSFFDETVTLINTLHTSQKESVARAAEICATAMENDGVVHLFGSGHSVGFGYELIGKAGTLVPFHQILTSEFVTRGLVSLAEFKDRDNIFERRPHIADKLYEMYDIRPQDAFIIISNSGINGLVIDLAMKAKQENHPVIVITSLNHTLVEVSRHPSQKKLMDFGDVVIDNCGPYGDVLLDIPDGGKIGSVSSLLAIEIAHWLVEEIIKIMVSHDIEPPLLKFEVDEAAKLHNEQLRAAYLGRISS